jgi:GAF domain-containing protein
VTLALHERSEGGASAQKTTARIAKATARQSQRRPRRDSAHGGAGPRYLRERIMSEGIELTTLPRDVLPTVSERVARLREALPQIRAVLSGERDAVALEATLACLLWETLPWCNWVGFYRRVEERTLKVGPYHGTMGCLTISFDRGVCGAAARTGEIQRVPDVHAFAGHIACDDRSRSELVIPVVDSEGRVRAVLDLDSTLVDAFAEEEAMILDALLRETFTDRDEVRW